MGQKDALKQHRFAPTLHGNWGLEPVFQAPNVQYLAISGKSINARPSPAPVCGFQPIPVPWILRTPYPQANPAYAER